MSVAVVEPVYAAFIRGDIATVMAAFAPDATIEVMGDQALFPFCGRYSGTAGITDFFTRVGQTVEILEFAPDRMVAHGDLVMVNGHERLRMRSTGREVSVRWLHLFTIAQGRIAALTEWPEGDRLLAAHRGL